jgi:hypothetical protein
MNRNITKIMLVFSFLMLGGFTAAHAQIDDTSAIRAKIPFSFVVRDKTLPAGEYLIKQSDDDADATTVLQLTSLDKGRRESILFETTPDDANKAPKESNLVFDKIGNTYFLSQIWAKDELGGNKLEESKTERDMLAGNVKKEKFVVKVIDRKMAKKGY